MTRYLISFDDGAMTYPEEDLPVVAEAAHKVVHEAKDAGVWVVGGGLEINVPASWPLRNGHRWPLPRDQGVIGGFGRRRDLTRGGTGVG